MMNSKSEDLEHMTLSRIRKSQRYNFNFSKLGLVDYRTAKCGWVDTRLKITPNELYKSLYDMDCSMDLYKSKIYTLTVLNIVKQIITLSYTDIYATSGRHMAERAFSFIDYHIEAISGKDRWELSNSYESRRVLYRIINHAMLVFRTSFHDIIDYKDEYSSKRWVEYDSLHRHETLNQFLYNCAPYVEDPVINETEKCNNAALSYELVSEMSLFVKAKILGACDECSMYKDFTSLVDYRKMISKSHYLWCVRNLGLNACNEQFFLTQYYNGNLPFNEAARIYIYETFDRRINNKVLEKFNSSRAL